MFAIGMAATSFIDGMEASAWVSCPARTRRGAEHRARHPAVRPKSNSLMRRVGGHLRRVRAEASAPKT
jgi:hypothetical protein